MTDVRTSIPHAPNSSDPPSRPLYTPATIFTQTQSNKATDQTQKSPQYRYIHTYPSAGVCLSVSRVAPLLIFRFRVAARRQSSAGW
mmetsp:Transcript_46542/g.115883  ORF Transcript_46542/g.115883 Transcript_46542/m.115883 type:complete len:86 (-) Transcript_46542:227-484(-)